jgi:hypothetical protein
MLPGDFIADVPPEELTGDEHRLITEVLQKRNLLYKQHVHIQIETSQICFGSTGAAVC